MYLKNQITELIIAGGVNRTIGFCSSTIATGVAGVESGRSLIVQHTSFVQHFEVIKCLLIYNNEALIPVTARMIISVDMSFIYNYANIIINTFFLY